MALASRIASWGALVKFSHSVFALPFAVIMMIVVARTHPLNIQTAALLIVCVVSARTAAMGFNRFIDREIDAKNPRTAAREIPRGVVSAGEAHALSPFARRPAHRPLLGRRDSMVEFADVADTPGAIRPASDADSG